MLASLKKILIWVTLLVSFSGVESFSNCGLTFPRPSTWAATSTAGKKTSSRLGAKSLFKELTESNFDEEVYDSPKPVVLFISAAWCGPCKMVEPVVKEIEQETGETLKFVAIDADGCPSIVKQYGVRSVPTIALFKGKQLLTTVVGAIAKPALYNALRKHVDLQK
mmetsp:Transcript_26120/g.43407  ORF Transcript_26120/g.43407 Transcript_26120/m.43407 type:complete len:165 (+) Transcript_26120:212-706(+)